MIFINIFHVYLIGYSNEIYQLILYEVPVDIWLRSDEGGASIFPSLYSLFSYTNTLPFNLPSTGTTHRINTHKMRIIAAAAMIMSAINHLISKFYKLF